MYLIKKIFEFILTRVTNSLGLSSNTFDDLANTVSIANNINNLIAWSQLLLPITVIAIMLVLTGIYYAVRFVWVIIRLIRSLVSNINIFSGFFK
jgi:hypothetical protein